MIEINESTDSSPEKFLNPTEPSQVTHMFSRVARRYDLLNDLLSLGTHRWWRRRTVRWALECEPERILDCACGTGDLSFLLEKKQPHAKVTGVDACEPMLALAREKRPAQKNQVDFLRGDCLQLDFADHSFELTTIAFGIRNVKDPALGIQEMARVVSRGGKVVVLEFGQPAGIVGLVYRLYSRWIIPWLGKLFSDAPEAYDYLPETAAAFPAGEAFVDLMKQTGCFSRVQARSLSGGIAWYYEGVVA